MTDQAMPAGAIVGNRGGWIKPGAHPRAAPTAMVKIKVRRQRLSARLMADLLRDYRKHGAEFIETLRTNHPALYTRLLIHAMPAELDVVLGGSVDVREDRAGWSLDELIEARRRALALAEAIEGVAEQVDDDDQA